jgi:hypothetical protein
MNINSRKRRRTLMNPMSLRSMPVTAIMRATTEAKRERYPILIPKNLLG